MISPAARPEYVVRRGWLYAPVCVVLVIGSMMATACSEEKAIPIDPANPPTSDASEIDMTDVTHSLDPTPEMEQLARQQCLDDPEAGEGYIQAVNQETGEVMAEASVDCADVRSE